MSLIITHDDHGFPIEQGSQAWKELRIGLFTGTSMASLIPGPRGGDKGRQAAIDEVVAEILTGKPVSSFKASKYMKEGIEKEPYARMLYSARTDDFIDEVAFIRHDWLRAGASPDGLVKYRRRITEFKSPKETTHARYLMDPTQLVRDYFEQCQTNIWLADYADAHLVSFHPDFDGDMRLVIVEVKRDDAFIKKLETEVIKAHAEVNTIVKQLRDRYSAKNMEVV